MTRLENVKTENELFRNRNGIYTGFGRLSTQTRNIQELKKCKMRMFVSKKRCEAAKKHFFRQGKPVSMYARTVIGFAAICLKHRSVL